MLRFSLLQVVTLTNCIEAAEGTEVVISVVLPLKPLSVMRPVLVEIPSAKGGVSTLSANVNTVPESRTIAIVTTLRL